MARYKTPQALAKITGATEKHPERYGKNIYAKSAPLGDAPAFLSQKERNEWKRIAKEFPWLARSDRMLVEIVVRLLIRIQEPGCPIGVYAQLRLCLAAMGGSPVDAGRVHVLAP